MAAPRLIAHPSGEARPRGLMNRALGLLIILAGGCLILAGLLLYAGAFKWFGRLPGDIRYEGEHIRIYVPIVSMLIISIALSLIAYLVRRLL